MLVIFYTFLTISLPPTKRDESKHRSDQTVTALSGSTCMFHNQQMLLIVLLADRYVTFIENMWDR